VSGQAMPISVKISKKADPQAVLRTLAEQVMMKR
jgi:hypothetical protein